MRRLPAPEESSVADRLFVLQLVRVLLAVAILLVPAVAQARDRGVALVSLAYLVFVGAVEVARRALPDRSRAIVSWSVLVDGLAVCTAIALTGGYHSPLVFLVFLDVTAVTLVVSYRTGLELAVWCALLLLLAHAAADAGVVDLGPVVSDRRAVMGAATFLLFAVCTAAFSAVKDRSLRRRRRELESLVTLGTELERAIRRDDVAGALVRHATGQLGFRRAAVLTRRGSGWTGVADDGTVAMHVDVGGCPHPLVEAASRDAGVPALVREVDDELLERVLPGVENAVVTAVAVDGEHLGVMVAEWGGGRDARIPTSTVQALAQASMHAALALRNADLLGEVERLATRDSLTGLANRRLFDESLRREAARSRRLATPLSLVVLDVDHFKQVNDTYGHQTGDRVLHDVGIALVGNTKAFDVAARYGGDEFVLLLPGCQRDDAISVAERVRTEILRQVHDVAVTVSAGVATMPDNARDGDRLIAAADGALYDAKRGGRDRVAASSRSADPQAVSRPASLARGA